MCCMIIEDKEKIKAMIIEYTNLIEDNISVSDEEIDLINAEFIEKYGEENMKQMVHLMIING